MALPSNIEYGQKPDGVRALRRRESLYDIPPGCICMGDGLFGMKCWATSHAVRRANTVPSQPVENAEGSAKT